MVIEVNMDKKVAPCPYCAQAAKRHSRKVRRILGLHHREYRVRVSCHLCPDCMRYFVLDVPGFPKRFHYAQEVVLEAVRLVREADFTLSRASQTIRREHGVRVPSTTLHEWVTDAICA